MTLDKKRIAAMLRHTAALWQEHTDLLSEIDSRFGDGDHGVTIGKLARQIEQSVSGWRSESVSGLFEDIGIAIFSLSCGSAGPLYGTMIGGFAEGLAQDRQELAADELKAMFAASLREMQDVTTAKVGEKTMMDVLFPAVEAANAAPDDVEAVLKAAAEAAQAGADATKNMVSKFGRARSYGEQTIGTPDAGAISAALFFRGLWEGLTAEDSQ